MNHKKRFKKTTVFGIVAITVALVLIALAALSYSRPNGRLSSLLPSKQEGLSGLVSHLMGLDGERTFLLLFLNNTELRPGGGFIGTYAVARVRNGKLIDIQTEGAELLDARAPYQGHYPPPQPIIDHLKVDQWQFRDANWSPDFAESAQWILWLYRFENGAYADRIDGVIGVTASVLDELVSFTGPVVAKDVTLSPGSAVADLEYEVEYAFAQKGIPIPNRKDIMQDLAHVMVKKLLSTSPTAWLDLLDLFKRLGSEKQVIFYSTHDPIQKIIEDHGWGGRVMAPVGDGFVVVDANLGALKTDHAMDRHYTYSIKQEEDKFVGTLTAHYQHNGQFDWRTSRYRSYTRVYVPEDATVLSVEGFVDPENPQEPMAPDMGEREGFAVYGGYVRISPGQTQDITVRYILSEKVHDDIENGMYTFSAQKQIGLIDPQLTLDFDFGKTIEPDGEEKYAHTRFFRKDFSVDLEF